MTETTMQQIKSRFTSGVIFECEIPSTIASGMAMRYALEKATAAKKNLRDADLRGADLSGAYLSGADLSGADLSGADLSGAYLRGAYLSGADLSGAYLRGAYLRGADLRGAYLRGAYLSGADLRDADLSDADLRGADGESLRATPEKAVENLDKVRAIVMDEKSRLEMGHWHESPEWKERSCAEEMLCGTTHCLAGWLQVCSTVPEIRNLDAELAGILSAPVASKMFFKQPDEVFEWLETRAYVKELNLDIPAP